AGTMPARSEATPEEKRHAYLQAARCALELGKADKALELFDRAVSVDASHVATLLERADGLRRLESWEAAIKAYQAVLVQHAAVLAPADRAGVFRKLALIHKRLENAPQTLAYYRKVLEFAPHDRETLG